jgi:hypothetical protein
MSLDDAAKEREAEPMKKKGSHQPEAVSAAQTAARMMAQWQAAVASHDITVFLACFSPLYQSVQPDYPGREIQGLGKVRENWSAIFTTVPDVQAEITILASDAISRPGIIRVETAQRWYGTRANDGKHVAAEGEITFWVDAASLCIVQGELRMHNMEDLGIWRKVG